jgi:hypothetical protein
LDNHELEMRDLELRDFGRDDLDHYIVDPYILGPYSPRGHFSAQSGMAQPEPEGDLRLAQPEPNRATSQRESARRFRDDGRGLELGVRTQRAPRI